MKIEKIVDLSQVEQLLMQYKKRGGLTNNFLLPDGYKRLIQQQKLFYITSSSNLCFIEEKETCMRVYYHINNEDEHISFPEQLNFALEILYRGDNYYPSNDVIYWDSCGFRENLIRDLYEAKFEPKSFAISKGETCVEIKTAEKEEDIFYAKKLFDASFDAYTGDYLSIEEIKDLSENKQLYVAYYKSQKAGALHSYIHANKVWLGHLAVDNNFRGNHVGKALLNHFIDNYCRKGYNNFALWVQKANIPAVAMYKSAGFGYRNKSTLSMLKLKTV